MNFATYFLAINISLVTVSSVAFAQASQQIQGADIKPFEVEVLNLDRSMTHGTLITLTNKELKVFQISRPTETIDSLLFSELLSRSDTLFRISKVDLDQVKYSYLNPCAVNESNISVYITKNGKEKQVYLSSYYQQDVGNLLTLVNMLVPEKYKVWYDRKVLEAESCTGYERGEAIELFDSASGNFLRLDSTHTTVSAIDKNGLIIWKTELDSDLWGDVPPVRGKNDSVITKENRIKENGSPEVTYFRLSKHIDNSWCRSPTGSATLWIRFYHIAFQGLDVKNGNVLCWGRD